MKHVNVGMSVRSKRALLFGLSVLLALFATLVLALAVLSVVDTGVCDPVSHRAH
ncbi:MAG: hypothetical protein ACYC3N_03860 [Halothiobacillus sp.]